MVQRGPFKRQALKVLVERQIPIATIIDIGVLSGTPELMETFPKTQHILLSRSQSSTKAFGRTTPSSTIG